MAVAAYATDLTDITTAETISGWSALGGGQSGLSDETDYFIQGSQCVSKTGFTATTKGQLFNAGTTTITAGDAVFIWVKQNNRNLMDTVALGGSQVCMGSGTGAFDRFYTDGNDSDGSALAGWRTYCVDPTDTPSATTGSPGAYTYFGNQWKIQGSGSLKGNPNGIDAIRHGREIQCTAGEAANYATFDGAAVYDSATTRAWGLITPASGSYQFHGAFVMGTSSTAVDFRDSDRVIVVLEDEFVPSGFNEFEIRNASSNVEWNNIQITALGATSPGILTLDVGTFTGVACFFTDLATTIFNSSSTVTGCTWNRCEAVTPDGADMSGSSILAPDVAANNSGLIWNVNTDPDGLLDGMEFSKTSGTAHHAIEFGLSIPTTSITLRDCNFGTDFSATEDGSTGDETFHFKDTTGTITLNLVSCTGNFGYRTDGVVVTVVADPVTTAVNVKNSAGSNISGARVLLRASDGTGPLPYQDSVTITQSAGTATVTHTAHGLVTGNYVVITGASPEEYNKQAQITVTGVDAYTYSVDSGLSSPATGTPVSTGAIISGTTNASGNITDSRTLASDQPVTGYARKSTTTPFYKSGRISGVVDNVNGVSFNIILIVDE